MLIPDDVRKCVAFLGAKKVDGTYQMVGTAFFVGRTAPGSQTADPCYAVTARHVVDKVRGLGIATIGLRVNTKAGQATWLDMPVDEWIYVKSDPTIDVAIREMGIPPSLDHLAIPFSMSVTDKILSENEVGPSDEVFVTGLFHHHHGTTRNIPIVRIGALACMAEEKVTTEVGEMEALLIEARSIGGLSGSPVFLHLGAVRAIGGQTKFASGQQFWLMGLIHGHFNSKASSPDAADDAAADGGILTPEKPNTGIAIVVPFHQVEHVAARYEERKKLSFTNQTDFSGFNA